MLTIHLAWAWLAAINATLPYSVLTVAAYGLIYAWRKLSPASWLWLESRLPWAAELDAGEVLAKNIALSLPSIVIGAALAALTSGGGVLPAVLGAVAGAFAPLLHHVRKALPFDPYRGAVADPVRLPKSPRVPLFPLLCLALFFSCSPGATRVPCDASDHQAQLELTAHGLECRARVQACRELLDPYAGGAGGEGGAVGESPAECRARVIAECDAWGDKRCAEGGSK
jgi:hypothetical protein